MTNSFKLDIFSSEEKLLIITSRMTDVRALNVDHDKFLEQRILN